MCRSYQNCASRRDWHGHGTQAAQPGLAHLIRVFPSGVLSSTGKCVTGRRERAAVVACMSALLLSTCGRAPWPFFPAGGIQTAVLAVAYGAKSVAPIGVQFVKDVRLPTSMSSSRRVLPSIKQYWSIPGKPAMGWHPHLRWACTYLRPQGYFVGDYTLMAAAGNEFVDVFSQPLKGSPDVVFAGLAPAGHKSPSRPLRASTPDLNCAWPHQSGSCARTLNATS
jgi:hypothetical protein